MAAASETAVLPVDEEIDEADTWSRREGARMRQILIGKARPEYKRYVAAVPVEQRDQTHPRTPDPRQRVSKRQFDRNLGEWRKKLHEFDAKPWGIGCEASSSLGESPSSLSLGESPQRATRQPGRTPRRQRPGRGERAAAGFGQAAQGLQACAPGGEATAGEGMGVVKLRLADKLPEFPMVASHWHASCDLEGLPLPTTPQRSAMHMGLDGCEDGATPAPLPMPPKLPPTEADMDKAAMKPSVLFTPVSTPCFQVPEGVAPEVLDMYGGAGACAGTVGRRWPTPPPMPSGTPRTPERAYGAPSPPNSCLPKTPTRCNWVMDTPSPQRFHYALLPSQVMPVEADPSCYGMGPMCNLAWSSNTWDMSINTVDLGHWE